MHARLHVMNRRVAIQEGELADAVGRSVFRHPRPADRELVEAQHVHHPDGRQRGAEQLGPLIEHRADQ